MKCLFLLLMLIALSLNATGQSVDIKLIDSTYIVEFGAIAEIQTEQNPIVSKTLISNRVKFRIAENEVDYILTSLNDTILNWEFRIPQLNKLVGKQQIYLNIGSSNWISVGSIYIISQSIELNNFSPKVLYSDSQETQQISFKVNNVAYIDTIKLEGTKIEGTYENKISSSNNSFKTDPDRNIVTIGIVELNATQLSKVKFSYRKFDKTNRNFISEIKEYDIDIPVIEQFLDETFNIQKPEQLYIDDIQNPFYEPPILFDFKDCSISNRCQILNDNSDLKLTTHSDETEFDMPSDKKLKVQIRDIESAGIFKIEVVNNKDTCRSILKILPKPEIEKFFIPNAQNFELKKIYEGNYSFKIHGEQLHQMKDLNVELVNKDSEKFIVLPFSSDGQRIIEINTINCNLKFDDNKLNNILTGEYYLRLSRLSEGSSAKIVYPFYDTTVKIVDALDIIDKQISKEKLQLYKPTYFKKKKDTTLNYVLLEGNSQLIFQINELNTDDLNADNYLEPQFLKIKAKYTTADNKVKDLTILEGKNNYIRVYKDPIYINLKDEFNIRELGVNEKIEIFIRHSPEVYGSNKLSPSEHLVYHRGIRFWDKIGLTLSLPPYLAAFRGVKRKSFETDENGETVVKYDGDKKPEIQSLLVNAGLGLKFRPKTRNTYDPNRLAFGLYAMGLDLSNSQNINDQKLDEDNYDFIGRGSLNLMTMVEYSFINLESPYTKIPIYAGGMYIIDPIDSGSHFAFVFGLGIDIKLSGSN